MPGQEGSQAGTGLLAGEIELPARSGLRRARDDAILQVHAHRTRWTGAVLRKSIAQLRDEQPP